MAVCFVGCSTAIAFEPQDAIIYEVNPRAFSQSGDLDGVTERLDELQTLGVNMLWLMPIHPVGQVNKVPPLGSPYSVRDYHSVGAEYGDLQDLQELISGAHSRNMKVMLDWVPNHTAWDHAWINNPGWYTQNGSGEIIHPPGTTWYDVADLNYNNAAMRAAMIDEMQYWARDVGVDGFRVDAADFVPFDFWQQAVPAVRSVAANPLLMLAEGGRPDHYTAGFDITYDWTFYNATKGVFGGAAPATNIAAAYNSANAATPAGKTKLRFTTNHDENAFDATPIELFGSLEGSLAAYAATLAYGATPLVYTGQEIGWSEQIPFFSNSQIDWSSGEATQQWYQQMLGIYGYRAALREGSVVDASNTDIVFVQREHNGEQVYMAVNTRNHESSVSVPAGWQGVWFDQFTGRGRTLLPTLDLNPYEVVVLSSDRTPIEDAYNGDSFFLGSDIKSGEYQLDNLVGQASRVFGWSGPWEDAGDGANLLVTDEGLKYPLMQVAGGAVLAQAGTSGRAGRKLTSPVTPETSETMYFSFLVQANGTSASPDPTYAAFELLSGDDYENSDPLLQLGVGLDLGNGPLASFAVQLEDGTPSPLSENLGDNSEQVNLFVIRLDLSADPDSDSISVWRNPNLRGEPAVADFVASNLDLAFDRTLLAKSGGPGWVAFDELRMGPTYDSVIYDFNYLIAGDFNGDGGVDGADYAIWRGGFGSLYDLADYDTWRSNFGATNSLAPVSVVPAPPALLLLAAAQFLRFSVAHR